MGVCSSFCGLFSQINWLWYIVAVVLCFAIGALWYSLLFTKAWMRVFKIERPETVKSSDMIVTMLGQLLATALLGITFFVLTAVSVWLAVLVLVAICGWQKGSLKFRYTRWDEFLTAALVEAGYTFVAGVVFILFALI